MEILYLWIKSYKMIHEVGYNFSGLYRFSYDAQMEILHLQINQHHIDGFFEVGKERLGAELTNLTAIVGQNGTGKSTVLHFVKDHVLGNEAMEAPSILAVKEYEGEESRLILYVHESIAIQASNHEEFGFELRRYTYTDGKLDNRTTKFPEHPAISNTSIIFFSNIFDGSFYAGESAPVLNISTNYLVAYDRDEFKRAYQRVAVISDALLHRFKEVERQVEFVFSDNFTQVRFSGQIPERIEVGIYESEVLSERYAELFPKLLNFVNSFQHRTIRLCLLHHAFIEAISFFAAVPDFLEKQIDAFQVDTNLSEEETIMKWFADMIIAMQEYPRDDFMRGEFEEAANIFVHIVEMIIYLEMKMPKPWQPKDHFYFSIENDREEFWSFFKLYKKSYGFQPYLTFDWQDMSSGEKALLNIYSRFYHVHHRCQDNLIVLIDEGELYLHPQWQKELVKNLVEFLPQVYRKEGGKRRIQVILTSNSPFVASDLPSFNVIFLNKAANKLLVMDGLEEHNQTFASNINTLLANSFFMKDGVIGSFAKYKINRVIQMLVKGSDQTVSDNRDEIKNTIHIIGEPLIKNKLLQMLEDRLKIKLVSLDDEIAELKQRIMALEEAKQHDSN
ncbi:AAA family ATPase [Tumebacillus avium]|nr:AAA family ATPase [Tumebacillus avium]